MMLTVRLPATARGANFLTAPLTTVRSNRRFRDFACAFDMNFDISMGPSAFDVRMTANTNAEGIA